MKIGIVGNGFVGQATLLLYPKALIYDIIPEKCVPLGTVMANIATCGIIFICVPTPVTGIGNCYTNYVEDVVNSIRTYSTCAHVVIRSTVPPGTCDKLKVHSMPEFLTEKNWLQDFKNEPARLIGVNKNIDDSEKFITIIRNLYKNAKECGNINTDTIEIVEPFQAEIIKYTRNAFLAVKVAFFNEIYSFCQATGVDFDCIHRVILTDQRIGSSHTNVPGDDGKRGFSGTCLPKDLLVFINEYKERDVENHVMTAAMHRNSTIDRSEKDWEKDSRSYI